MFQFIRTDKNRIVIRHYDEEKDCFCKICAAQEAYVTKDKLLIADGMVYLSYEGKIIRLDKLSAGVPVLKSRDGYEHVVAIDTRMTPLRYPVVFIYLRYQRAEDYTVGVSYVRDADRVQIVTPPEDHDVIYSLFRTYCSDGSVVYSGITKARKM